MKKALITGITGQDGSYLAEFLLEKGYEVHGIKRRASLFNTQRVDHIYEDPQVEHARFRLHYGDLTDSSNLTRILSEVQPDEVYNLGASAIPTTAQTIWERIGLSGRVDDQRLPRDAAWGGYPGGLTVTKAAPLFPRK